MQSFLFFGEFCHCALGSFVIGHFILDRLYTTGVALESTVLR